MVAIEKQDELIRKIYWVCNKMAYPNEHPNELASEVWLMGNVQEVAEGLQWVRIKRDIYEIRRRVVSKIEEKNRIRNPKQFSQIETEFKYDPGGHEDKSLETLENNEIFKESIAILTKKERIVVYARLVYNMSLREISLKLGCTRERVRQIQNEAVKRIRQQEFIKAL